MRLKSEIFAATAAVALLSAGAAAAQSEASARGAAGDVDEVVVTARRVAESLQSVPLSVTAVSQEELRRQKITSVEDLQFRSPALTTSASLNRSTVNYNIRGQTQQNNGSLPSVQVYVNETPLTNGTFQLYDLESVQVLKGPQGTLFGRNTTGGAVLFTTRKPTGDFDGYVQATAGELNLRGVQGAVNVPLMGDVLALRVAGDMLRRDGYTTNLTTGEDLDDQHVDSWRVSLRFRPTDTIDNQLVYDGVRVSQNGGGPILTGYIPGRTGANTPGFVTAFNLQQQLGPRDRFANIDLFDYRFGWGVSNAFSWDLGPVTIRNITGYRKARNNASYDQDGTGIAIIETTSNYAGLSQVDLHTINEEFQVLGETGRFKWIAGLYADRTESDDPNSSVSSAFGAISRAVLTEQEDRTQALFGQVDIGLDEVAQGLKATLGYRYTWDKRSLSSQTVNLLTNPATPGPVLSDSAKFEAPTWTIGLNWQVDPDLLVYVVSRRGYKSGGFNTLSAIAGPQQRFRPEYLTDYELGVKKDFRVGDMRGRVNLAAFTGDYEDIQRSVIVAATTSATINAAKATIRGFELEASLIPVEGLELYGFWSYLDAQYDEYRNPFSGQDLSDAVFPNSPENKLSLTARYRLPLDQNVGDVYLSGTVYHQSRTAFSDDNLNFPPAFGGEYTIANFNLDWENVAGRPIDASLYVKNAFDEDYISGAGLVNSAIYGFATLYYGEPRTWGVQLRYRFGASAD